MYERMVRIGIFEQSLPLSCEQRYVIGMARSLLGEEAVAVGVYTVMDEDDYVMLTNRGTFHEGLNPALWKVPKITYSLLILNQPIGG